MTLSAVDDRSGSPVDWWFIYKLPAGASSRSSKTSDGYQYLYFDARSESQLALSPHTLDQDTGALYLTFKQLYAAGEDAGAGWIVYNDEMPYTEHNDTRKGHTKGLLAFNSGDDSALWMLHSTPRFPGPNRAEFPQHEESYGQSFLCVTLKDVATARCLATRIIQQQQPQVYSWKIPDSLENNDPVFGLCLGVESAREIEPCDMMFRSNGDQEFRVFAKHRHWGGDFWIDLVAARLGVDLQVETGRRGTRPGTGAGDDAHDARSTLYIDLRPLGIDVRWPYTLDHSKWAASRDPSWIVIADFDRQASQIRRGGCAVCFQHEGLWRSLSQIETYRRPLAGDL